MLLIITNYRQKVEKDKKLTNIDLVEEQEVTSSPRNELFLFLLSHTPPLVTFSLDLYPLISPLRENTK